MKKTGREPQVPGRAGGGGRAGVLLRWAAVGLGAGFINGLLGAAGGILLVTALPYLPTPSLLSVGANPYGQAGADRRDLFASALAVMLPVSAVSALRYRLAGVDPLPRSLLPLLLPAAAGGLLGAFLLERTSPRRLRRLFAAVILVSRIRVLF